VTAKGALFLQEVDLSSDGSDAVHVEATDYATNVIGSTFSAWGTDDDAIDIEGGTLIVEGSSFLQAPDHAHVKLSGAMCGTDFCVKQAMLMTNSTADGGDVKVGYPDAQANHVSVDSRDFRPLTKLGFTGRDIWNRLPAPPVPKRTDAASIIDVTKPSVSCDVADSTGVKDSQSAIQCAIDALGTGGGTVYLPGGTYMLGSGKSCKSLRIHAGVELLGANASTPFGPTGLATLINARPDPTCNEPFILLGGGAGIRGLGIFYQDQDGFQKKPFAPTIQSQGRGSWLINVALANSYDGADFASADTTGHYIDGLTGYAFHRLLSISKSSNGTVRDYNFGPGFWLGVPDADADASLVGYPIQTNNPIDGVAAATWSDVADGGGDIYRNGEGLVLGSAKNELLVDVFSHAPHTGLRTIDDDGGPAFTLVNFGSETFTAFHFSAVDGDAGAVIVNGGGHTLANSYYPICNAGCSDAGPCGKLGLCDYTAGESYVVADQGVQGSPVRMFALAFSAYTPVGFDIQGGAFNVQGLSSGQNANNHYTSKGLNLEASVKTSNAASAVVSAAEYSAPFDPTKDAGILIEATGTSSASLACSDVVGKLYVSDAGVDTCYQPFQPLYTKCSP
jgi:hypothetical protein